MHRIKTRFVMLAATAALIVPVAAAPAEADQQNGLVNVHVENLLNNNQIVLLQNVAIPVAANVCGIQANVLSAALIQNQKVTCKALNNVTQDAWVSYD
jgi:hypothetical protein